MMIIISLVIIFSLISIALYLYLKHKKAKNNCTKFTDEEIKAFDEMIKGFEDASHIFKDRK